MPDFEVCPIGTQKEVELSRELYKATTQLIGQYGEGIIPREISLPYHVLKDYRAERPPK